MALPKYNITLDAIKQGAQTAQQMFGTSGVSAAKASSGAGTQTTGSVPQSTPAAGSQASHQAWINNAASGQGGMDAYTARQNERYGQAIQSNDTDLINKLIADSQRVGYGLSYDAVKNTPAQTQTMGSIPQDYVTSVQSSSQLNQYAQDQTAMERAALLNAINTQIANVKNNAEYSNQLVQDNRVLEDFFANQRVNPFSGGADYRQAMTARGRSIDDSSRAATLENTLGSLQQEITNFDKLTPERQRAIYNELLQLERNFGLNVGQLTGTYGGQRTLAGAQQDWGQQMDLANLTGNINSLGNGSSVYGGNNSLGLQTLAGLAGTRTLAGQQMDLANKGFNMDQYWNLVDRTQNLGSGPKSNMQTLIDSAGTGQNTFAANQQAWENEFTKNQTAWENAFKEGQFDFQKAQTAWENAFKNRSFEQDMKEAAASRGLQWASLGQRQKEFVADQAWREKTFEAQQKQQEFENDLAYQKAGSSSTAKPTTNEKESVYYTRLDSFTPEQLKSFFKNEKANIIADLGKNGYEDLKSAYSIFE
ncbi:hypothetical protein [Paenibacillus agaridevorans]|uniref:hypothetical protein n=1 Tax=Paenibacillus agaridevorans TaxID=171404 RepID=UPI001BE4284A|nr:hypothetical protein [Paenibacillus agaridevorans]